MDERTRDARYTQRLVAQGSRRWKRMLDVQAPYRWNLRRLRLGATLDIGCGIGRNLRHLGPGAVGVDHNPHSVAVAVARGLTAFTPEDFQRSPYWRDGAFDSILLAHVAEHMTSGEAGSLLSSHARFLRPEGRAVLICPQEAGFRSDPTHVEFMDFGKLRSILQSSGFSPTREYSFPFPRLAGRFFPYNEFVAIGTRRR
jgi:SAM-dependent methyltransferase